MLLRWSVIRVILALMIWQLDWHQIACDRKTYYLPVRPSKTTVKIIFLASHFDLSLLPAVS